MRLDQGFPVPKDYLCFRLTGGIATDPGDASAGLVYDFVTETWPSGVLDKLGIDAGKLPPYDPGLKCFETAFPGVRFRMAAMLNGGVALEWVRSMVGIEWDAFYEDFDAGRVRVPQDLVSFLGSPGSVPPTAILPSGVPG